MATEGRVLSGCLAVVSTLEELLRPCFGPTGLTILVESSDGHASSMHNALQLVASLQYKVPSSLLVVEGVKQLYTAIGDGGKKFLLMLAAALKELSEQCHGNSLALKGSGLALRRIRSELVHSIIPAVTTSQTAVQRGIAQVADKTTSGDTMRRMVGQLAEGTMRRSLPLSVREKLLEVVSTLIFPTQTNSSILHLQKQVNWVLKNCEEVILKIPGVPCSETCSLPGFVLDRGFLVTPQLPLTNFRCVLLLCGLSLDDEEDERNLAYSISSRDDLSRIRSSSIRFKEMVVQALVNQGIKLVLTACKVDTIASHCLRANCIGAIQMVPEETLRYMAECCGGQPIAEIWTLLNLGTSWVSGVHCNYRSIRHSRVIHIELATEPTSPGTLSSNNRSSCTLDSKVCPQDRITFNSPITCRGEEVQEGSKELGQCEEDILEHEEGESPAEPPCVTGSSIGCCSVLLCGVTMGQCRQLASQLLQALRAIAAWINHQDEKGRWTALRGGGIWEVGVARALERRLQERKLVRGDENWIIYKALQKAFLSIPICLLENSNPKSASNCVKNYDLLFGNSSLKSDVPLGVDIDKGVLIEVDNSQGSVLSSAWEPYWSQVMVVQCVCDCLMKCLRIDGVIMVKSPLSSMKGAVPMDDEEDTD